MILLHEGQFNWVKRLVKIDHNQGLPLPKCVWFESNFWPSQKYKTRTLLLCIYYFFFCILQFFLFFSFIYLFFSCLVVHFIYFMTQVFYISISFFFFSILFFFVVHFVYNLAKSLFIIGPSFFQILDAVTINFWPLICFFIFWALSSLVSLFVHSAPCHLMCHHLLHVSGT